MFGFRKTSNLNLIPENVMRIFMENAVFWDVAPCRSCVNRRFGGIYCLLLLGRKILERGTNMSSWLQTKSPVENTELYKNKKGGRVGHMGNQ
jgi:hypothetical protein